MAQDKKSFLLYCDITHTVSKLSDDQAGKLFKHILDYVNDKNPETDDIIIQIAFEPIKQQLKRDLKKYENRIIANRENGKLGGRPPKPKKPIGLNGNPTKAKKPDNDIDIDTDNDIDNVNDKDIIINEDIQVWPTFQDFWNLYDKKTDRAKVEPKWNKLNKADKESIMKALPDYIKSTPDKNFRKNPFTYLNSRSWENEIINKFPKTNSQPKYQLLQ